MSSRIQSREKKEAKICYVDGDKRRENVPFEGAFV